MDNFVFHDVTLDSLDDIAQKLLKAFPDQRIFAFHGDLGAGKTTLIKSVCRQLGVHREVTSPTFAIINEYDTASADLIYHFDFYRIKKIEEVLDIGYEEYLYGGRYCFLEWPEKIEELLPDEYVYITIIRGGEEGKRTIRASISNGNT